MSTSLNTARQTLANLTTEYSRRLNELPADARTGDIKSLEQIYGKRITAAEPEVRKLEAAASAAASLSTPSAHASVTSEPTTYHRTDTSRSWLADMYAAQKGGDPEALARLQRNNAEDACAQLRYHDRRRLPAPDRTDLDLRKRRLRGMTTSPG